MTTTTPKHDQQVKLAREILVKFALHTGELTFSVDEWPAGDKISRATDLIVTMLHYLAGLGEDLDEAVARAMVYVEAELSPAGPVTIAEIAVSRGVPEDDGSAAWYHRVGLPIFGGCSVCNSSIAAYNAFPSCSGFWKCADCIGEDGFSTVESFELWTSQQPE